FKFHLSELRLTREPHSLQSCFPCASCYLIAITSMYSCSLLGYFPLHASSLFPESECKVNTIF
ncbi:MAG: hypothetical protein II235_00260, partial [Muribaculaceae bacterium]|nr:hypothetical protein [Muribaculaceae bacterium]